MRKKIKSIILMALIAGILSLSPTFNSGAMALSPRIATIIFLSQPSDLNAGIKDRLCSAITGFLDDKTAGAAAASANCKTNCSFTKEKLDLLKTAQKKANNSCAKGAAPDIKEIGKNLDKDTQNSLNNLYKQNSVLFDGVDPNLKNENFNVNSQKAAALNVKSGNILSFKSYDPNINKVAPLTDFSLKKPTILLASAKEALIPTVKAASSSCKRYTTKPQDACARKDVDISRLNDLMKTAEKAQKLYINAQKACNKDKECIAIYAPHLVKLNAKLKCLNGELSKAKAATKNCGAQKPTKEEVKPTVPPPPVQTTEPAEKEPAKEEPKPKGPSLWNKLRGKTKECGKDWYNPNKKCCMNGKILEKCAGKECLNECKCTGEDCKDINSGACSVACNDKKICLPQRTFCPKGWDDAYWGKTREEGETIKKWGVKLNLDSLTGHGVKGKIVSWRRPAASRLLKYAAEGIPEKERTDLGELRIDNEYNKGIVKKIKKTKAYKEFLSKYNADEVKPGYPMIIEKSDNKDLYYALHKVEYIDKEIDKKNNKIKFYFKDKYDFKKPKESDSDLIKAGWRWQENKWIKPYKIKIVIEDKYKK